MNVTPNYEPLFYWVREREEIRRFKETLESKLGNADAAGILSIGNLTHDQILTKYRFCNVRREDDRVTIWIRKNIREPFASHEYLWLMLCIARQINWPVTLQDLITSGSEKAIYHDIRGWPDSLHMVNGEPYNWLKDFEYILENRKSMNLKVYTGAYMISAPAEKGVSKQHYMADVVIGALWRDRDKFKRFFEYDNRFRSLKTTHELLSKYIGWGPFMAYQAVVDMRFTRLLSDATDIESWCAAGPGTIRGLNRLYNRPLKYALSQEQARIEIRAIWKVVRQETGVEMDFSDVPNCLCETDKYLRVKNGEGTPRALYVPGRGS